MATLDGQFVFGVANRVRMNPNTNANQINAFFGVEGVQTLYGGSRGRTFMIDGFLAAASPGLAFAAESLLLTFADGFGHTLVDNFGNFYQNVVFHREYQRDGDPRPARWVGGSGYGFPYRAVLHGLT